MDNLIMFTNATEEDFVATWDGKEYTFPAMTSNPVLIGSPLENQEIRKIFAKKLAERELFKSKAWRKNEVDAVKSVQKGEQPLIRGLYSDDEIAPYVQACLSPLPEGRVTVKDVDKVTTEKVLKHLNRPDKFKPIDEVEASGALNSVA
jgi:hypothetical protein